MDVWPSASVTVGEQLVAHSPTCGTDRRKEVLNLLLRRPSSTLGAVARIFTNCVGELLAVARIFTNCVGRNSPDPLGWWLVNGLVGTSLVTPAVNEPLVPAFAVTAGSEIKGIGQL